MILRMLKSEGLSGTCSVSSILPNHLTFVRSSRWLNLLNIQLECWKRNGVNPEGKLVVLLPLDVKVSFAKYYKDYVVFVITDDVEKVFVEYHNWFYRDSASPDNVISPTAKIHPTAVIGADSMKNIYDPDSMDHPIQMKHMGRVVIEDMVKAFPHATIHRGSLGDTVIGENAIIGSYCNIGHNVRIGKNTAITPYVCVGGSAQIGEGCVIGMGSIIRDGVKIADRTKIGMGSVVVKDTESWGLYYGSPAERKGNWNGCFHK